MKLTKPTRKTVAKAVGITLIGLLAIYGMVQAVKASIAYANQRLDAYATERVSDRHLPITVSRVEVPVLNQDQLDKLNQNVTDTIQKNVKDQVDSSIKSYLK